MIIYLGAGLELQSSLGIPEQLFPGVSADTKICGCSNALCRMAEHSDNTQPSASMNFSGYGQSAIVLCACTCWVLIEKGGGKERKTVYLYKCIKTS